MLRDSQETLQVAEADAIVEHCPPSEACAEP
jgi:hypothetical protein